MTLLSIATQVADSVGLPRPATVATGTDQLARQMFALANEILEELCKLDWPILETAYTFNTVVNQQAYALPNDWDRAVVDSAYLSSQYYALRGSMTSADWQRQRNALPSMIGRYKFRIFGNPLKINFAPTPSTVQSVSLEYITTNYAKDTNGNPIPKYAADSDVSVVPEDIVRKGLKWKIKHAKGLDYSEDFNDYEISKARAFAQQLDLGSLPVAFRHMIDIPEVPDGYVPEFGYGA